MIVTWSDKHRQTIYRAMRRPTCRAEKVANIEIRHLHESVSSRQKVDGIAANALGTFPFPCEFIIIPILVRIA